MMISGGWDLLGFGFISGHRIFVATPHNFDLNRYYIKGKERQAQAA